MRKVLGFIVALALMVLVVACTTEGVTFTVTFDSNGGSAIEALTIDEDGLITEPADPTLLGNVFAGWYADEALTDAWSFGTDAVTADLTLYAKWTQAVVTFSGVDDVEIAYNAVFDILDGVSALGNDGVDYTEYITFSTIAHRDSEDPNKLDTTYSGDALVRYEVVVNDQTLGQIWRTINVGQPQAVEGQMLVNPDFSEGLGGWNDSTVNYIADGATMELSVVDGALQVVMTAGSNLYTPRFGQKGITIEQGKTYEVSFRAKSSVEKTINLQFGELLSSDPWFTDFKPGNSVVRTITTEWAEYSYKFTMNLETNENGAILFELGTYAGEAIDATMWFDDINIEESTPDADTTAPLLSGIVESRTVLIGGSFDPLAGVTAIDATDGDLTSAIVVEILDADDQVVTVIDTSVATNYTINYSVTDVAGNEATASVYLEVVGMQFYSEDLVVNGDFEAALGDPAEWGVWSQDWGSAPTVVTNLDTANSEYTVDISNGGGDAAWAVQLFQEGITLVEGTTYRVVLNAKSSVERTVNIAIGYGDPWVEYARFNEVTLTTDYTTQEFVFTVTQLTYENVKLVLELGTTANFSDAVVSVDSIAINEAMLDTLLENGNFADGWTLWYQNWGDMPTVTYSRENDMFNITTDKSGEANWAIQFNQNVVLEQGKTYVFSVDAKASVARDINIKIFKANVWVNHLEVLDQMLTTEMVTYTYEFTVPAEADVDGLTLSFEMGLTANFAAGTVSLDNISLVEKDLVDAPQLIVNGDATTVPGFFLYTEGADTFVLGENGAVMTVDAVGGAAYQPHVYQILDSLAAGTYTLKLVVSATVARDLRLNVIVPDWGYVSLLPDTFYDFQTVENDQVAVYVTFTLESDVSVPVKVELDFGGGFGTTTIPGVFTIEEVLLYQVFN